MYMKKSAFLAAGVIALCLALSPPSHADMKVSVYGGGLGQAFTITLEGPPNESYMLIMSTTTGPTVTPWITLDVGVELLIYSSIIPGFMGYFDGTGTKVLPLAAPHDPLLHGFNLNFQNCLLNNMGPPILDKSNLYRVTFQTPDTFLYTLNNLPDKRSSMAVAPLPDGSVILAGGLISTVSGDVATDDVLFYRPHLEAFEAAPFDLPAARSAMTATVLLDGRVLLLGGLDSTGDTTTTSWIYDPSTNSISSAGAMSEKRMLYQAVLLDDGRVLVMGGFTDPTDEISMYESLQKSTEIFDPALNDFTSGPNMAKPRGGFTATKINNGKVVVAGGVSYFVLLGIKIPELLDAGQVYTPQAGGAGSFSGNISMTKTRAAHTAHLLPNGKVLLASGATGTFVSYSITTSCDLFDPSNQKFTSTGSMTTGRILCQMITRPDGKVLAAAGGTGDLTTPVILGSSEAYNPSGGSWSAGPDLNVPRFGFGYAPLPDGTHLFVGGLTGDPATGVNTAEIYQP